MADDRVIAPLADVPEDTTLVFRVCDRETNEVREALLVRTNGAVAGWLNHCQHFTHIRLDKGSGAQMRGREIVCQNHGAMFEADTGLCTVGPCEGAYLEAVDVAIRDGDVTLTDDRYGLVGRGPIEREDWDLTSTSNVEF